MTEADQIECKRDALDGLLGSLSAGVRRCTVCSIPRHTRTTYEPVDTVSMLFVVAGSGSFGVGGAAGLPIGLQNVLIVPPRTADIWIGDEHADHRAGGQALCASIDDQLALLQQQGQTDEAICVIRAEIDVRNSGVAGFFDHLRHCILETLVENDAPSRIFDAMISEMTTPKRGTQAIVDGLMTAFLVLLLRQYLQRGYAASSVFTMMADPRLARAMAGVLARPDEQHSIDSLATVAGMSRSAFIDTFRKVFAKNPSEFLQEFRLKFAAHLLTTTDLSIQIVASSVGYSSRSYFSRAFRASFETDPSSYRTRHRT